MIRHFYLVGFLVLLAVVGCREEPVTGPEVPDGGTITGPDAPTPYALEVPDYLPAPITDPENPLSEEGVELGRHLFYDASIFSTDGNMSCASCHKQELAFTDGLGRALGVRGEPGPRSAMSLVNLAFNPNGFNWDGRSPKLWEQAIHPVEDMLELDNDWEEVIRKLREHADYPARFRAAFGIDHTDEITRELTVKALAQFERTIISADSKFDRVFYQNTEFFTEQEQLGADSLFFVENVPPATLHPGCGHCHNAPTFGDNKFHNNGIEDASSLDDIIDKGYGDVTGSRFDNGKFRTPTLRNIALTAPYMHDGRFKTLEEVIDHYASGGHNLENEDPNITGFTLTEREKAALLAFLHTLTDESLLTDPRYAAPE
ncbi:cytochrome-c peroxidase [Lewinella sp. IMCC34183]|uniref:cytochrome-c peroxidase n=1 Tax=Lewinella sp. IMCC34183 TaxID=2248762 RepID=UPI000E273CA7|nr:cytochrome c peroxidase [Lewinella sp. IMCC34183]